MSDPTAARHLHSHALPATEAGPATFPETLVVTRWIDPWTASEGHEARSSYVERFWLGILGPSTTWLWRRLVRGLEECPGGFRIHVADTGRALGLGQSTARNSMIVRSIERACQFGAARFAEDGSLQIRTHLPALSHRQLRRLPPAVQASHRRWVEDQHTQVSPGPAPAPHLQTSPPAA